MSATSRRLAVILRGSLFLAMLLQVGGFAAPKTLEAVPVNLAEEAGLQAKLPPLPEGARVAHLVTSLSRVAGKPILIMTSKRIGKPDLTQAAGATAKEAMEHLETLAGGRWMHSAECYVLLEGAVAERSEGKALPFKDARLTRKPTRALDQPLYEALLALGGQARAALMLHGPPPRPNRTAIENFHAVFEPAGKPLRQLMEALATVAGGKWEVLRGGYVLNLRGQQIPVAERTAMQAAISTFDLCHSFSPEQLQLLQSGQGLQFSQMSGPQRSLLAAGTGSIQRQTGVSPDRMRLRMPPGPDGRPSPLVEVDAFNGTGWVNIGAFNNSR